MLDGEEEAWVFVVGSRVKGGTPGAICIDLILKGLREGQL